MPSSSPLAELRAEILGRRHRVEAATGRTGGPAGNRRLTAWAGLLLLALVLAELVTLLDVSGLIAWHVVLGVLIAGLTVIKTASTTWRMVRYYRGHPSYRAGGAPLTPLRILGPLVVVTAVGLLASGIALILLGVQSGQRPFVTVFGFGLDMLTLHQAMFFAFAATAGLHVIGRLGPALTILAGRASRRLRVPGARARIAALLVALGAAAVVGALLLGPASSWGHGGHHHRHRHRHGLPAAAVMAPGPAAAVIAPGPAGVTDR